jgi:hypothetical protein
LRDVQAAHESRSCQVQAEVNVSSTQVEFSDVLTVENVTAWGILQTADYFILLKHRSTSAKTSSMDAC